MTQTDLADAIKVKQVTVSRYETGVYIPIPEVMGRIRTLTNDEVSANDFYPEPQEVRDSVA